MKEKITIELEHDWLGRYNNEGYRSIGETQLLMEAVAAIAVGKLPFHVGDRVQCFQLARDNQRKGEPWDRIGIVTDVSLSGYATVQLEGPYRKGFEASAGVVDVPFDEMEIISPPLVKLTAAQIRALLIGPWADGFRLEERGLAIVDQDDKGWIIVGDYPESPEDWGSESTGGVWMDTVGSVWYSPSMPSEEYKEIVSRMLAGDMKDPHPVKLLHASERSMGLPDPRGILEDYEVPEGGILVVVNDKK